MKKTQASLFIAMLLLAGIGIQTETAHAQTDQAQTDQTQTPRYNIDVVIFEDSSGRYLNSERWPIVHHLETDDAPAGADQQTDTLTTNPPATATSSQAAIDSKDNGITHNASDALAEQIAKLESSSRYKILLHQSWQQTGLSDNDAISIHIDSRKAKHAENEAMTIQEAGDQNNTEATGVESSVQGTLKLILSRYLHIHADLLYKRSKAPYQAGTPALQGNLYDEFEIKAQRRMRSNELHYIDHPLLGMLVLVSPIKPSEPEKN